jgi:hypothetical protein
MKMLGDEVASFVNRVSSDSELWSACWERLNRNARTCGTGAIASVGEGVQFQCCRPEPGHRRAGVQVVEQRRWNRLVVTSGSCLWKSLAGWWIYGMR